MEGLIKAHQLPLIITLIFTRHDFSHVESIKMLDTAALQLLTDKCDREL
jgi:hypothetical protein